MHSGNGTPMDMDLIGSFLAMQGVESQGALTPGTHTPYNPATVLEQQFKLTQLQQLQQLQNQIFQQQVRHACSIPVVHLWTMYYSRLRL